MVKERWVGRPHPTIEGGRLVRGAGRFIAALNPLPGVAHAAVVRSPHAHALILTVDPGPALAMPGVLGVLTAEHVCAWARPFPLAVEVPVTYYPLAVGRVRYVGEPVAVVVAEDPYLAADAAGRVAVEYRPLEPVVDPEAAMGSGAPLLHPEAGTNIGNHRTFTFGDPEAEFARAELVVEEGFTFPRHTCLPLETYGVVAHYDAAARQVTIWANFHGPFVLHTLVAHALNLPLPAVRLVVPPDIGGSFGIKSGLYPYMVLMALASRLVGRPVKWVETRSEHLMASAAGAGRVTRVRAAFRADGVMTALHYRFIDDVGAYIRSPEPAALFRCFGNLVGPYRVQNLAVETYAVMTNKAPTALNRGFGGPQLYFALERVMDLAAERLGLDPVEIRRRNLIPAGAFPYRTPSGGVYDSGNYPAALEKLVAMADYPGLRAWQSAERRKGRLVGIGLATVVDPSGTNIGYITLAQTPGERARSLPKSGATELAAVGIDPYGGVTVRLTTAPQGQGHATVAAQVVADELGVPPESVRVVTEMDTGLLPWTVTTGTYSSRFAGLGASAVLLAARRLREKLARIAAHLLEAAPEDLELVDGAFAVRGVPERRLPLRRVAGAAHWNPAAIPPDLDPNLYAVAAFSVPATPPASERDEINSSATYGFVADLCVVEVDPETFEVRVLHYFSVHDAGRLLNPAIVEGQVHGAFAHGLGCALFEELRYDENGQLLTGTLLDYACIRADGMPPVQVQHLETPSPVTLLGAKGVGEAHVMSAPAALANAVADALKPLGIRVTTLPLTPGRLFQSIKGGGC
jgi:2-furoyl-CoA dehydrogenase large subunit